jgi:hypothetical protein
MVEPEDELQPGSPEKPQPDDDEFEHEYLQNPVLPLPWPPVSSLGSLSLL